MITHRAMDRICLIVVIAALLLSAVLLGGEPIQAVGSIMGYEQRLFDTTKVHTIDIRMDNWEEFIAACENEEYAACTVVIDGESYGNVGIRAKGNTSLSSVSSMGSDRYSFKIEFDQYEKGRSYYGLDKLSLNNLIQDNTYMKDYLTYTLMNSFEANAPLCSYVNITVNGEEWGLYLAVEGVEDAFLQRNYGADHGELYKPDSMSFGGGRGNGRDFNMNELLENMDEQPEAIGGMETGDMPQRNEKGGEFDSSAMFGGEMELPENFDPSVMTGNKMELPEGFDPSAMGDGNNRGGFGGGFGGMGSSDVKLQYSDSAPESYSNIFDNAKTEITETDQMRLIEALEKLSEGETIEDVVDIEAVLRYFVVHNFVVNGDSYTGSIVHNYYLYEKNGKLSMLPWDYNLAYGTFQGDNANSTVNDPIDSPLSVSGNGDRPMADWIFTDESYTNLYHQYFAAFLEQTDFAALIETTATLISPYVEKDPSKFCTYEEFKTGVDALKQFCLLREESVLGQLEGTVPSTDEGQSLDGMALVDTSGLNLSDMGTMGNGMGGNFGRDRGERAQGNAELREKWQGQANVVPPTNESFVQADNLTTQEKGERPTVTQRDDATSAGTIKNGSSTVMLVSALLILLMGLVFVNKYKR